MFLSISRIAYLVVLYNFLTIDGNETLKNYIFLFCLIDQTTAKRPFYWGLFIITLIYRMYAQKPELVVQMLMLNGLRFNEIKQKKTENVNRHLICCLMFVERKKEKKNISNYSFC